MGSHPQVVARVRPCWNTSRTRLAKLLVFCLRLHAFFCIGIVHVSAQHTKNGFSNLDYGQVSSTNSTAPAPAPAAPAKKLKLVVVIILIVVGVIVFAGVTSAIIYLCYRKMRLFGPSARSKKEDIEQTIHSYADAKDFTKPTPKRQPTDPNTNSGQKGQSAASCLKEQNESIGTAGVSTNSLRDMSREKICLRVADVKRATGNFGSKIGQGGFGPVYYGKLGAIEVAVKVQDKESRQGAREFATEVEILSRTNHPNLVSLIGYSEEKGVYMLIYEFLSGGTLQERLYGNRSNPPLDWKTRLKIAVQAAKGLEYLHNECDPSIIHRDVKSNNILLTKSDDAKVTDFGLSKFLESNAFFISKCSVKGTSGYLDPEYFQTQKLTHKSDVYSFGVLLLELASGREPLDTRRHRTEWKISAWARSLLVSEEIEKVADEALGGKYNTQSMWTVAELAMSCVEPRSVHRPTISEVVLELEAAVKQDANGTTP